MEVRMKKMLLLFPLLGAALSGCAVNQTLRAMECNRQAIDMSTQAICENVQAIEEANRKIDENRRELEQINQALKHMEG